MSTTAVDDVMPATVPLLEQSGVNWAVFQLRFRRAVQRKGLWGHFDGSIPRPTSKLPSVTVSPSSSSSPGTGTGASGNSSGIEPTFVVLGASAEITEWICHENIARSLLTQKLSDSTLVVVDDQPTVMKMWEALVKEYTYKGCFPQTRTRQAFLSSRCLRGEEIRAFLGDLEVHHAELDAVGVKINDDDYRSTILRSLPTSLLAFAYAKLSAAGLNVTCGGTGTIEPDLLITMVSDEWDRTQAYSRSRGEVPDGPIDATLPFEGGKYPKLEGEGGNEAQLSSEPAGEVANVVCDDDGFPIEIDAGEVIEFAGDSDTSEMGSEVEEAQYFVQAAGIRWYDGLENFFGVGEGRMAVEPKNACVLHDSDKCGTQGVVDSPTLGMQARLVFAGVPLSHHDPLPNFESPALADNQSPDGPKPTESSDSERHVVLYSDAAGMKNGGDTTSSDSEKNAALDLNVDRAAANRLSEIVGPGIRLQLGSGEERLTSEQIQNENRFTLMPDDFCAVYDGSLPLFYMLEEEDVSSLSCEGSGGRLRRVSGPVLV